jgi:hypothetical protein
MRTSELTGAALDWAVAKCEGRIYGIPGTRYEFQPSTHWAQGGPIIEQNCIMFDHDRGFDSKQPWRASLSIDPYNKIDGPTPLIAAMRCYVASKLGKTIDIPEGLT